MAIRPSRQALEELNNARANKKQQLAQAYAELGGSNTALTPNYAKSNPTPTATIPTLEKAVVSQYEQAQNSGGIQNITNNMKPDSLLNLTNLMNTIRGPYGNEVQENANLYRELKNQATERAIANTDTPEVFTMPTVMGMGNGVYGMPTVEQKGKGVTRSDLQSLYDEQNRAKKNKRARDIASAHPVIGSAMATISRPIESAEGVLQNLGEYATGKALSQTYNPSAEMREQVNEGIKSDLGRLAYGGVNSISDMALAMLLAGGNPNLSSGIMGLEKANDVTNDANARGLTPNQILAEGALSGVSTALTERLPMGRFADGGHIVGSMLSEGAQEGAEDIVDTFFDELVTKLGGNYDKSTLRTEYNMYLEAGYTPEEAQKAVEDNYKKQLGLDVLLGGITGGLMQGGSNLVQGNNVITGKPRTQTEENIPTVNAIDDVPEDTLQMEEPKARAIPSINSIEQEQQIQNQRIEELRALQEAMQNNPVQTEEQIPAVTPEVQTAQPTQNVPELNSVIQRAESAVNTFLNGFNSNVLGMEELGDLRNELLDLGNQNPDARQQINNLWRNVVNTVQGNQAQNVETTQTVSNRDLIQQGRDTRNLINLAEQYKAKLSSFGNKSFDSQIDNAITALRNGDPNAAENLNTLLAQIDEQMNGETVGVSERALNQDMYDQMKNVTDGRVIHISPETLRAMDMNVTELNNKIRTGTGRLRFVTGGGTPIDSVYQEMYDLAGGMLPEPRSMGESDMVDAIVKYMTDAKSGKNNIVNESSWNDVPLTETRSSAVVEAQNISDALVDNLLNGEYKTRQEAAEALSNWVQQMTELGNKYPEARNSIGDIVDHTYADFRNNLAEVENAGLKEEVASINNVQDAQTMLESEIDSLSETYPLNIQFLGGGNEDTDVDVEESISDQRRRDFHTGIYKDSKVSTNSFPRSKALNKTEMNTVLTEEQKQYEAVTHEATLERATNELKEDGYKASVDDILTKKDWDAVDTDKAMLCAFKSAKEARYKVKQGADPTKAWQQTVDLFKTIREHATAGGQAIEALKKWASRTPEGKLAKAIAFARELAETADPKSEAAKQIAKQNNVVFTDEFMKEFLEKAHQYDDQEVSFAKQARLDQKLAHMVWSQIPKTWRAKFTSLWMDNLLASFRTLISRNVGGNAGKFALDQTATKLISGPIDTLISRLTGGKTTTGFTKEGWKVAKQGLKQGAFNTTMDYWGSTLDPDKVTNFKELAKELKDVAKLKENIGADASVSNRPGNEGDFNETLKNNRTVFEKKAFKIYDKLIKYGLAVSDNTFYKSVYDQTLYELNTLRKEGKLEKALQDLSDDKFETWAKAVATSQGLEAVYQNDSTLSNGAMDIKKGVGEISKGLLGVDVVSNASFPFVRTPMNVINTNLEYSPLGVVKNTINTIKEIRENLKNNRAAFTTETSGGSFKQNRFVRETSRNIVGSLLFGLALVMKNAGMLTGAYSDNEKEREEQKKSGMQEYALVSPFTGNQWSVDWIPALGSNLVAGSAFDDAFRRPDQSGIDAVLNGAKAGAKSLFEQSALQGLQRLVGQQSFNTEDSVIDNAINAVANTASSAAVPSFLRQTAAALDPYKRNTYGMGGRESIINNAIAGIPILREHLLQPRIGSDGQPIEQNAGRNGLEKWLDNLVNPAMVTVPSAMDNAVRDEAMRLYNVTKNYDAFQPNIGRDYLEVNGRQTNTAEYTEFLQRANSAMNQIASDFIQSDFYSGLTDEEKVAALNNIYGAVQRVERARYLGIDKDFDSVDKAYAEGGADGLINYMVAKSYLNQMGSQNNPDNREAVIEMVQNGEMEQTLALSNELQQAGLQGNLNETYKYEHASQYIPSLTPTDFAQTFTAIDQQPQGTSGHGSISQGEILDYLNQNPSAYSDEDAMQLWNAYGTGSWVYIPVLNEDGTWHNKKV